MQSVLLLFFFFNGCHIYDENRSINSAVKVDITDISSKNLPSTLDNSMFFHPKFLADR